MIDPTGVTVVGIGCHHPDLAAGAALGCDLARQPMAIGGVQDPGDGAFDGEFDVTGRARAPAAQKALHRPWIAAVVDKMGERSGIRRQ
jgi:hypothetical protein